MWRNKKVIIAGVVVAVLLAVGIAGVAFAQTGDTGDNTTQPKTLIARVAEILGIDQQKVEDAFTQARTEMRNEALDNYLNKLVADGRITQAQADEFKAWVQSKPDMSQYRQQLQEWQQSRPGIPQELQDWQNTQPDVPLLGPFGGYRGGMMRGGGGMMWGR